MSQAVQVSKNTADSQFLYWDVWTHADVAGKESEWITPIRINSTNVAGATLTVR